MEVVSYTDDCINCGRSQMARLGHLEKGPRRCPNCGENPERVAAHPPVHERQALKRHLDCLDFRNYGVVEMRWRDEPVPYAEIARLLGLSNSGAREAYAASLRQLRRAAAAASHR